MTYIYKAISIIIAISVIVSLSGCKNSASNNNTNQDFNTPSVQDTNNSSALPSDSQDFKSTAPNSPNNKDDTQNNITLSKVWEFEGIVPYYNPVVNGNNVIIFGENVMFNINKDTGEKNYESFLNFNYAVYFYTDSNIIAACNAKGFLEVTDINTGNLLWTYGIPHEMYCNPVTKDGVIYSVTTNGILHALDLATGDELWTLDPQNSSKFNQSNTPIIIGDTLYFIPGQEANLYAVDLKSQKEKWHIDNLGLNEVVLANKGDTIYAISDNGIVCAINTQQQKLIWKVNLYNDKKYKQLTFGSIDNDALTLFNKNNHIYRVDLETGNILFDYTYEGNGTITGVSQKDNTIFFTTGTDLASIDKSGHKFTTYGLGIPVDGNLAVNGDELYLTNSENKLFKYKIN